MLLSDKHIKDRIIKDNLITNSQEENIRNCAYSLRVGQLIEPETGDFLIDGTTRGYAVKPNEVIIVMTVENVHIPNDICASYTPLFRVSTKGMMLVNPSIVEPGYQGPLSCIFLNFSSVNYRLNQGDKIAKISFHQLLEKPENLFPLTITQEDYEKDLTKNAPSYKKTFLDIESIKERAVDDVKKQAKRYAITGGVIVSLMLLWSAIQPFIQKPFYKTAGLIEQSQRLEETSMIKDIEKNIVQLRKDIQIQTKENEIKNLQDEVKSLKVRLNKLEGK